MQLVTILINSETSFGRSFTIIKWRNSLTFVCLCWGLEIVEAITRLILQTLMIN